MDISIARSVIKQVLIDLTKHSLKDDTERDLFKQSYSDIIVARSSISDLTASPSIETLSEAIREGLTAVQDHRDFVSPELRQQVWNPTVAAFVNALSLLGKSSGKKTSLKQKKVSKPKPNKDGKVVKSTNPAKAEVKSSKPEALCEPSTPRSEMSAMTLSDGDSKTDMEQTESAEPPMDLERVNHIRSEVASALQGDGPYFLATIQKNGCSKAKCRFCSTLAHSVHLTPCARIHPKTKPCHTIGWWPHIGYKMWNQIRFAHKRGEDFKLKEVPCKSGDIPMIRHLVSQTSAQSLASPLKRPRDSDESHLECTSSKMLSSDWSDNLSESDTLDASPHSPTYNFGDVPPT
jgi:hypothetical protein